MSRKFLTVLALVALFVAAMTGAAMAAPGYIVSADGVGHGHVGSMDYAAGGESLLLASGDLYYYNNQELLLGRSLDIAFLVGIDGSPNAVKSVDRWGFDAISSDKSAFKGVSMDQSPSLDKDGRVQFRFEVSFDELPLMISIDNLVASSDSVGEADIQLRMKSVDVLVPQTVEIAVGQTDGRTPPFSDRPPSRAISTPSRLSKSVSSATTVKP